MSRTAATARTTTLRSSPPSAPHKALPPRTPAETNLLSNMTYWAKHIGAHLVLQRSSTQLELDTGIARESINGHKRKPGLIDRLHSRGDIEIIQRGTHQVNTGGRYKICAPIGPTRSQVSEHADRLMELIRSWVRKRLIGLGEVSALQGLVLLPEIEDLNARHGNYEEISRRRGLTKNGVRAALRRSVRNLGTARFAWRKGRGGTGSDAKQPVFIFKGAEKLKADPSRLTATVRSTEPLERLYAAIIAQPAHPDGWRRPFKSDLRQSSGLEKYHVDRLLPRLQTMGRIVIVPATKDEGTRQWKPVSIFIPHEPSSPQISALAQPTSMRTAISTRNQNYNWIPEHATILRTAARTMKPADMARHLNHKKVPLPDPPPPSWRQLQDLPADWLGILHNSKTRPWFDNIRSYYKAH